LALYTRVGQKKGRTEPYREIKVEIERKILTKQEVFKGGWRRGRRRRYRIYDMIQKN